MHKKWSISGRSICFLLLSIFIIDSVFHVTRLVLGGSNIGRLAILLSMVILSSVGGMKLVTVKIDRYKISVMFFVSFVVLGYLKSFLLEGDIGYADTYMANGIIYFLFLPILGYLVGSEEILQKILRMILWIGTFLSLISVLLVAASLIRPSMYSWMIDILVKYNALNAVSAYSGIIRIMLNGIVFQIAALFVGILTFYKTESPIKILISIAINAVGIILTYTRGLIFGVVLSGALWLLLTRNSYKEEKKRTRILVLAVLVFLAAIIIYSFVGTHGDIFSFVLDRFLKKTTDTVKSDVFRTRIKSMVYEQILIAPIFGSGLGSHIDLRDGAIEMTYLDIVIRVGVVGLACFIYPYIKMGAKMIRRCQGQLIVKSLFCALSAIMIASFTNPYLITSGGIFIYCLCICVFSKTNAVNLDRNHNEGAGNV